MPELTESQQTALLWAHSVWLAGFYAGRQAALDDAMGSLELDLEELSPYLTEKNGDPES